MHQSTQSLPWKLVLYNGERCIVHTSKHYYWHHTLCIFTDWSIIRDAIWRRVHSAASWTRWGGDLQLYGRNGAFYSEDYGRRKLSEYLWYEHLWYKFYDTESLIWNKNHTHYIMLRMLKCLCLFHFQKKAGLALKTRQTYNIISVSLISSTCQSVLLTSIVLFLFVRNLGQKTLSLIARSQQRGNKTKTLSNACLLDQYSVEAMVLSLITVHLSECILSWTL